MKTNCNHILFLYPLLVLVGFSCLGQNHIRNFGVLQIHNQAQLGFYSSVQNDSTLIAPSGLVGFYGNNLLYLTGSSIPEVYDFEIANEEGLFLDIPIVIQNNINFIYGNIFTDRNQPLNFLELSEDAFYQGQSDFSKVDGFVQSTVNGSHVFPIGDEFYLRPLSAEVNEESVVLKAAYFFENPRNLFSNSENFSNGNIEINQNEFWKLQGDTSVAVTLSWNQRSSINEFVDQIQNLTVVGFHKETEQWLDLGATEITGALTEGFIRSELFIPNGYETITLGSTSESNEVIHNLGNFLLTPDGDGINDFFYIPELENYKNNRMQIFDRNGLKVFDQKNYTAEFGGTYTLNIPTLNKGKGLPTGVYFYIVDLTDEKLSFQGFLYLQR